ETPVAEAPIAAAEEAAKPVAVETTVPAASEAPKSAADQTPNHTGLAPKTLQAAVPMPETKTEPDTAARPADESATVSAWRDSDGLRYTFSFPSATPAASFRRGDTVWLLFDFTRPIDVEPIRAKGGAIIGEVSRLPLADGQAIRIRLNRPQMHSL